VEFYATSAQVIPVLLLALFLVGPKPNQNVPLARLTIGRAYRLMVLGLLYTSEGFALLTLAYGDIEGGAIKVMIVASQLLALGLLYNEAYDYEWPGPWRRTRSPRGKRQETEKNNDDGPSPENLSGGTGPSGAAE
jgi:hypothetical protein